MLWIRYSRILESGERRHHSTARGDEKKSAGSVKRVSMLVG